MKTTDRARFAAKAGWASLPWRAGPPKRRGLWAVEWVNGEVGVYDVQRLGKQWCADGGPQPMGRWIPCEDYNVRRSVGPLVKRGEAWFVETTPNSDSTTVVVY